MEKITAGIVLKQEDRGESDKLITLLTPDGIITAVVKGVKKSKAKLKFAALPFAFAEYSLSGKGSIFTVTGCTQIEDLSKITQNIYDYYVASFMSEVAIKSNASGEFFVEFLKTLKCLLYQNIKPIALAIHFCQYVIHNSGYGYDYHTKPSIVAHPIDLLYFTSTLDKAKEYEFNDDELNKKTFIAISKNFEEKFDSSLLSKELLINLV